VAKPPKSKTPNLTARLVGRGDDKLVLWRWNIGPALRQRGFRAIDLWADGPPFSLADARAHGFAALIPARHRGRKPMTHRQAAEIARELTAAAKAQFAGDVAGSQKPDLRKPAFRVRTMADLIADYRQWGTKRVEVGALSPKTWATYASCMVTIDRWFAGESPAGFRAHVIEDWHAALAGQIGPHGAHATVSQLVRLLRWAARRDDWAPFLPGAAHYAGLGLARPSARLRVGTPAEMAALLAAFDGADPVMGDALVVLLWSCARVHDGLTLTPRAFTKDTLTYRQHKTGTVVTIPLRHTLADRLPAMLARQQRTLAAHPGAWRGVDPLDVPLLLKSDDGRSWARTSTATGIAHHRPFNDNWNALRAIAARAYPSLAGQGINRLGEPCLDFRPQDTRDTSATRLVQAGCTPDQVASWHGSDAHTIRSLASHYIDLCPITAGEAGDRLGAWAEKTGMVV
jgi:integrase